VRENEPDIYKKAGYVCLPKDYLRLRLTGEVASDYSDASATLAFDIKNNCWSKEILNKVNIPLDLFPKCYDTVSPVGNVTESAAKETGLEVGTVVVCGGGDQVMQGIGNGATSEDIATVNIGTSGQVCFQSDIPVSNPKLNTNSFCGYKKGRWITMGAIMSAGLSLRMYKSLFDNFDYMQMDEKVKLVKPGSGGLIFLPYLNGERTPHVNPNISGMLMGLNIRTGNPEVTRAIMEGVSYSLMQCIEVCRELGLSPKYLVASGGGARSAPWLQIQADIYNLPLRVAVTEEQAGLGAAIAAGVGTGVYRNIEEGCRTVVRYTDNVIIPDLENHKVCEEYYQLYKETYTACSSVLERVTELGRRH
jgi:xylulokinase